jgi:hypothetical protein
MNPAATGGALGPQTGSYEEVFRQRAAVCEYKAADLASVAGQLERLNTDPTKLLAGRLDLSLRSGIPSEAMLLSSGAEQIRVALPRSTWTVHCGPR